MVSSAQFPLPIGLIERASLHHIQDTDKTPYPPFPNCEPTQECAQHAKVHNGSEMDA